MVKITGKSQFTTQSSSQDLYLFFLIDNQSCWAIAFHMQMIVYQSITKY